MNKDSMTRNTSFSVQFSSFLVILLALGTQCYDIESAIKRATVGPNVYLGSDGLKGCNEELGITSGVNQVPDSGMTASSYSMTYPPHEGRLLSQKWWQPSIHERGQYLMVDLQRLTVVRQSAVQGGQDPSFSGARVLSYFIYHSINGEDWFPILEREHAKSFMGNVDSSVLISIDNFPEPVMVRFVRFYPQRWRTFIALRVELYGCPAAFDLPVGISSRTIEDNKMSATSTVSSAFKPSYGRLYLIIGGGGWCANLQDTEQYLEVALVNGYSTKYILTAVATQGVLTQKSWVKSYYFSYNLVFTMQWMYYHDNNKRKLFTGNTDDNSVVTNHFMGFIVARKVRIHPQTWENRICLRTEVYGIDYMRHRHDSSCISGEDKIPKCHGFGKVCAVSSSNIYETFTCVCEFGYVGNTRTCEDSDDCSMGYSFLCSKEQYCFNGEGFTGCLCRKAYWFDFGRGRCIDIDECASRPRDICPYLTQCINTDGSFMCDCNEPGYLANGNHCVDIDECTIGSHTCLENSTCVNAAGSFRCFCNKGFTGDGSIACRDIDECETNYKECGANGLCINTIGSYYCACKEGFIGNGAECEDINECASDSTVCGHDALCVNLPGSYACQCKIGYQITDNSCQDINECQEDLAFCDKRAGCFNTAGSYLCVCKKGLYGDGFFCSKSESAGQCLEGDEECAAAQSERTRGKANANARKTAAVLAERARGKGRVKPEAVSEKTRGKPDEKRKGNSNEKIADELVEELMKQENEKIQEMLKKEGKLNEKMIEDIMKDEKVNEKIQEMLKEKEQGKSNEKIQEKVVEDITKDEKVNEKNQEKSKEKEQEMSNEVQGTSSEKEQEQLKEKIKEKLREKIQEKLNEKPQGESNNEISGKGNEKAQGKSNKKTREVGHEDVRAVEQDNEDAYVETAALSKSSGQSVLKPSKWIFSAILLYRFINFLRLFW